MHDRVLAIDYLISRMEPALVGLRFGDVQSRLSPFPQPGPMRPEDLLGGRMPLDAASQLMQGLNPNQQVRLQQLLSEGSDAVPQGAKGVLIEDEQRSSALSAQDVKEDRATVVKLKPEQPPLQPQFAAVSEVRVTRCVQYN